ncbi:tRNA (adenosine(37)-N6)-threonylcarbamoyltransferase complex ATPase subunit type 1 TsaE, partial [Mesorhizobium sp.]
FTLVQSYEARVPVHHFDLYRLSAASELDELGFDEALAQGAALVEWPERAEAYLPKTAVLIELVHQDDGRLARLSGQGAAFERAARSLA